MAKLLITVLALIAGAAAEPYLPYPAYAYSAYAPAFGLPFGNAAVYTAPAYTSAAYTAPTYSAAAYTAPTYSAAYTAPYPYAGLGYSGSYAATALDTAAVDPYYGGFLPAIVK